jgi:2-dehydropantoate 2-reductase
VVDRRVPHAATFHHFSDWSPAPDSTILLCTKCYDNPGVLARLPASATFLPIQNGFDPLIEERGTPLEGIASFVSECVPGKTHARITRQGRLHIGGRAGASGWEGNCVVNALRKTRRFHVEVVPDVLPYKYSKLMYNAAISPLAAAAGLDNGQLLSVPTARRLFFALLRENYRILKTAGVRLAKIGPFHPDTVQQILRRPAVARLLSWAFYPTLRGSYCSMSGDLPKGITEIDFYNRHLIELTRDGRCPINRGVYELVKRMERERIAPSRGVLDQLEQSISSLNGAA